MISTQQIETDLTAAIKARDQIAVDTLRGLKTRIQNEKTAKGRPEQSEGSGNELSETEIISLVKSEVKKRNEAAKAYKDGGRVELAEKELKETAVLEKYLPAQMGESELLQIIEKTVAENNFTAKDFGAAMGKLKALVGQTADGSVLAKLLKEKLKS